MSDTHLSSPPIPAASPAPWIPLALLYLAFFALGMAGSMTSSLVPALRIIYRLDFRSAMMAQWLVLLVSGALALPVLHVLRRLGAFRTICSALAVLAAACVLIALTVALPPFAPVLGALAVLAAGTTALQVAGNPMTASLGAPEGSHARLVLAQAFNSLGVLGGAYLGATIMLAHADGSGASPHAPLVADGVRDAYGLVALATFLSLALFALGRTRFPGDTMPDRPAALSEALVSRWAWAGALAIALYVGAEGAIGSIIINFLHQPQVLNLSMEDAGKFSANLYWGGALAGRFAGSWLLIRFRAPHLLGMAGLAAATLCLTVATQQGAIAGYAALGIGLFNSIMFPTIFSLTLIRSKAPSSAVSSLLCTAIAGGALISIVVGEAADRIGMAKAFGVPMMAYLVIALFAWFTPRTNRG